MEDAKEKLLKKEIDLKAKQEHEQQKKAQEASQNALDILRKVITPTQVPMPDYPAGPGPRTENLQAGPPAMDPTTAQIGLAGLPNLGERQYSAYSDFLGKLSKAEEPEPVSVSWQKTDKGLVPLPTKMTREELQNAQPVRADGQESPWQPYGATTVVMQNGKPARVQQWINKETGETDIRKVGEAEAKAPLIQINKLPKGMAAETAGKTAAIKSAIRGLGRVEGYFFKKDGTVDRGKLVATTFPLGGLPFSNARNMNSIVEDAIATKLRLETGATATADELKNIAKRFKPSNLDNDATIKDKFARLKKFMEEAEVLVDPEGKFHVNWRKLEESDIHAEPTEDEVLQRMGEYLESQAE